MVTKDRLMAENERLKRRIRELRDALYDVVGDHCESHAEHHSSCPICTGVDLVKENADV